MKIRNFILVTAMLMASMSLSAQGGFKIKLGGGFPSGDFADARVSDGDVDRWGLVGNDKDGGAGLGFNIGFQYTVPINSVKGLGIAISADVFYNGLNDDLKEMFADMQDYYLDDDYVTDCSITKPAYLNIPLMVGGSYTFSLSETVGLFAEVALGANVMKVTNLVLHVEGKESGYSFEETASYKYDVSVNFGYRLAAGVTFNNKYSVEVGYYNLGAGRIKGTMTEEVYSRGGSDYDKENFRFKSITPTMTAIRFGYTF